MLSRFSLRNAVLADVGLSQGSSIASPQPRFLNSTLLNFPVAVLGSASTNSISRGYLYGAIVALTKFLSSEISASLGATLAAATMNAFTFCPRSGQGTPITAHSATAGWSSSAFSTSGAPILYPLYTSSSSLRATYQ